MDAERFDSLASSLAAVGSRRRALVAALGGVLGGVLGTTLGTAPSGGAGKRKKPCPPCKTRKQGTCKKKRPDGTACGNGGICQGGRCAAAASPVSSPPPPPPGSPPPPCQPQSPTITCGEDGCGTRTDTCGDPVACGDCGSGARSGTCTGGTCTCPSGTRYCGSVSGCNECCTLDHCGPFTQCQNGSCVCTGRLCNGTCAQCCDATHCPTGQRCCNGRCSACYPQGRTCGPLVGEPACACICCSGSSIGAPDAGSCT